MYCRIALYDSLIGVADSQCLTRQVHQTRRRTSGMLWVYNGEPWKLSCFTWEVSKWLALSRVDA